MFRCAGLYLDRFLPLEKAAAQQLAAAVGVCNMFPQHIVRLSLICLPVIICIAAVKMYR